jgi:Glycosyl transferase family 2
MRLVMTLLVRDEEEVLEANLDYHLAQGVDFVIATDHGSTDSTPEILRSYETRGLARVLRVEGREHHQSRRVTMMARAAAIEYGADWIINNDADEFWWPATGTLADVLAAIPDAYGKITARRNNFLPCAVQTHGSFYERFLVRERESHNLLGAPLEPKVAHRARLDIVIGPGNHAIYGADLASVPSPDLMEVLHFPMRTLPQFERKVLATGIGYESLPSRGNEVGRDQLKLLELQRTGKLGEYFAERVLCDEQIAEGLRSGELVIDRRLARFMRERAVRGSGHGNVESSISSARGHA